ncbi:MAG: hypothetical protein ACXAC5_18630 [Promethearchaeota archaeon]
MRKISEDDIEPKKFDMLRISAIIRALLCIAGGIIFVSGEPFIIVKFDGSIQDIYFTLVIMVGLISIICSLIGLKYHKIGSSLCFIIGIGSLIFSLLLIKIGIIFIYGSSLIITGSLIGVIGLIKTRSRNFYWMLTIGSTILSFIGGVFFLWSGIIGYNRVVMKQDYYFFVIIVSIFTMVSALSRLKFPKSGSSICLIVAILAIFFIAFFGINGILFTLIGSIIGLITAFKINSSTTKEKKIT